MTDVADAIHRCFRLDGLAFPIPVLNSEEAEQYRLRCEELEMRLGGRPRTVEVRQMHLHLPWAHSLATHPRILATVSRVLGPDLLIWATELFAKPPEDETVSIGWHRDEPYLGIAPRWCATAWVALADSTVENGCMQAIPGPDHRIRGLDQRDAVSVELRAGEMSLHDAEIWHGSGPNRSKQKRVGFAIRFLSPRAGPLRGRPPVLLARGAASPEDFRLVEPPADVPWEPAVAALKESARRHLDALLENVRSVPPAASQRST